MKNSCDIVIDLLPLYHDEVCNESSRNFVEEHLEECPICEAMLEKIRDNTLDESIKKERERVVGQHAQAAKEKSLITGLTIAIVIPIIVTFIVNLAISRTLNWFFIVLTALAVFGSLTLVPLIVDKNKGLWTLGSFMGSLSVLLLTIDFLTGGGSWSLIPITSTLFGLSVLFTPYILANLPLTGFFSRHKGLLTMISNTLLLYVMLIVIGLHGHNHTNYWRIALLISSICITLPWSLFLTIKYLKANKLIKTGLCFFYIGLFSSMINSVIEWILDGVWHNQLRDANLFLGEWTGYRVINANINLLILLIGCVVGGILIVMGLLRKKND